MIFRTGNKGLRPKYHSLTRTTIRMVQSEPGYTACHCSKCNGESVRRSVATKHRKDEELRERHAARKMVSHTQNDSQPAGLPDGNDPVASLTNEVFRWTLLGRTSNAQEHGNAIWEQDREEIPFMSPSPTTQIPSPRASPSRDKGTQAAPATTSREPGRTVYDELVLLDNKLMAQLNHLTYVLGTDTDMLISDPLKDHERRLKATLLTLQEVKPKGDMATKTLLVTMLEHVERHISIIEMHTRQPLQ